MNIQIDQTTFPLSQGFEDLLLTVFNQSESSESKTENILLNSEKENSIVSTLSDKKNAKKISSWLTEKYFEENYQPPSKLTQFKTVTGIHLNQKLVLKDGLTDTTHCIPLDISIPSKTNQAAIAKVNTFRFAELKVVIDQLDMTQLIATGQYIAFNRDAIRTSLYADHQSYIALLDPASFMAFCSKYSYLTVETSVPFEWRELLTASLGGKDAYEKWRKSSFQIQCIDIWAAYYLMLAKQFTKTGATVFNLLDPNCSHIDGYTLTFNQDDSIKLEPDAKAHLSKLLNTNLKDGKNPIETAMVEQIKTLNTAG